jgi:hypothetical protein
MVIRGSGVPHEGQWRATKKLERYSRAGGPQRVIRTPLDIYV